MKKASSTQPMKWAKENPERDYIIGILTAIVVSSLSETAEEIKQSEVRW